MKKRSLPSHYIKNMVTPRHFSTRNRHPLFPNNPGHKGPETARMRSLLVVAMLALAFSFTHARGQSGYDTLSPFEAVRWKAGQPTVMVGAQWYELVSIDSLTREQLL